MILQLAAPLLAFQAWATPGAAGSANPLAGAAICRAAGSGHGPAAPGSPHHDGGCATCPYCAAAQAVLTPAPLTAPLPRTLRPGRRPPPAIATWQASPPVHATARSPPRIRL